IRLYSDESQEALWKSMREQPVRSVLSRIGNRSGVEAGGGGNRFRFDATPFAEGQKRGFVTHEEVDHASEKSRIVHCRAQLVRLQSRQRKEPAKHFRFARQPTKYGRCSFFRTGRTALLVIAFILHRGRLPFSQPNAFS